MSGPSEMEETAMRDYLKWELDPKLREQVSSWIQSGLEVEHFRRRLVFGTAGLRGQMGAGLDRMNSVTVMQATQGVVAHLRNKLGHDSVSGRGVAVAFDARHNSQMFAAVTAAVVLKSGVRLYLHPSPVPTPILAYTAKVMNCAGAVMITASHNPKNDNGYKLYGEDACQIIPPDDENVQRQIVANSEVCRRSSRREEAVIELHLIGKHDETDSGTWPPSRRGIALGNLSSVPFAHVCH